MPDGLAGERIAQLVSQWRARELRIARVRKECSGLTREQLEDVYQDTTLALLSRQYETEEHLLHALRLGIGHRSMRVHRDQRRRHQILQTRTLDVRARAHAHDAQLEPEFLAVHRENRYVVTEFLTELSALEQRVFSLQANGMRYRAIATALEIPVTQARNTTRAVERKRERFQILHDTGRLCGFRASTILAMKAGEATSDELAQRALAHLQGCPHCRAEHETNARKLYRAFRSQAAALLPTPALGSHLGLFPKLRIHPQTGFHRLLAARLSQTTIGERTAALITNGSGGMTVKIATRVVLAVTLAGGTLGATHLAAPAHHRHRPTPNPQNALPKNTLPRYLPSPPSRLTQPTTTTSTSPLRHAQGGSLPFGPGYALATRRPYKQTPARRPREETHGFSYLGAPSSAPRPVREQQTGVPGGGGEFSP